MIERLLNLLYDFNPSPNAGAMGREPWTREEKLRKFKRDLQVIFRR